MKFASKVLALGALLLFLPASAALAQAPSITPIGDVALNVGGTAVVNVVAVDPNLDPITLTASGATFATLNPPTTGTGVVITTMTLLPVLGASGDYTVTISATAGGQTDTETFVVRVYGAGSNLAPVVVSPPVLTVTEGNMLSFTVNASDGNGDGITFLSASGLPSGANFVTNSANTSGTFTWTPNSSQSGHYDVVFIAANGLEGSAATHIQVLDSAGGGNRPPVLSVPATLSLNEGATASFTLTATDLDGDHVTLSASGLPSGATFTDNGNNTASFSWIPSSTQSGTYSVTFTGNDGYGGVTSTTTVFTVLDVGGGGGGGNANATIIGKLKAKSKAKNVCFRIVPVNGSFDLRNVDEASITLDFNGSSIAAVSRKTRVAFDCPDGDDDGHDGDDGHDDDDGDDGDDGHDDDDGDDGDGGHDGDDDDCECGDDRHDAAAWDDDDGAGDDDDGTGSCVATHLRACFSMSEVRSLLGVRDVRDRLLQATISGDLTTGGSFVATIGTRVAHDGNGNGDEKGKGRRDMNCKASPNPLNPETKITFTLSQAGRVRMTIFDIQGRQVKTLIDEYRAVGDHEVRWDGSDVRRGRVASGLYFVKLHAPEAQVVERITVLK